MSQLLTQTNGIVQLNLTLNRNRQLELYSFFDGWHGERIKLSLELRQQESRVKTEVTTELRESKNEQKKWVLREQKEKHKKWKHEIDGRKEHTTQPSFPSSFSPSLFAGGELEERMWGSSLGWLNQERKKTFEKGGVSAGYCPKRCCWTAVFSGQPAFNKIKKMVERAHQEEGRKECLTSQASDMSASDE